MSETPVTPQDVAQVEAELLAKRKAQDEQERARATKLIEDAESKGKAAAMKEFEEAQARKKQEEELIAVRERAASLEEKLKQQIEESAKKFQAEIEALKSERKGISRNDSPFNNSTPSPADDILARIQSDPAVRADINRRSAEAAARALGVPVHAWTDG